DYRRSLQSVRQLAYERAARVALSIDDWAQAIEFADAAVAVEPLREAAVLPLIRALAAAGDVAGAVTRYEQFRRALADELGIDPSSDAQALQTQLLAGETPAQQLTVVRRNSSEFQLVPFVG